MDTFHGIHGNTPWTISRKIILQSVVEKLEIVHGSSFQYSTRKILHGIHRNPWRIFSRDYRQMKGVVYYRNHTYSFNSLQLVFFIFTLLLLALWLYFYAPDRIIRGILFLSCLFVCLSVCLSVVNFNICCNFWTVRYTGFIFGKHTQLMMPFWIAPRSMTLWRWLWPLC